MPTQALLVIAVAAMAGLAALRLARVRSGRTPLPDGRARRIFLLTFVVLPPIALGALIQPVGATGILRGLAWVPPYTVIVIGLAALMWVIAAIVQIVVPGRSRPTILTALVGTEGDPEDVSFDPPLTARLAQDVALVDRTNAVFPRGRNFPSQIDRAGFRGDWDALDEATGSLERRIADEHRLGIAVADAAKAAASDARSRLDTLHRMAADQGQAWAV